MRILLVEDDELLGDGLHVGLKQYNYTVDWVRDGMAAHTALQTETFDTVVLDLGLPKKSGLEVLAALRRREQGLSTPPTPVIILTARDSINDRVTGLDHGADDYLVKPFDLDELCARIRALHRRMVSRADPVMTLGSIRIDPAAYEVSVAGEPVSLSRREYALLCKLAEKRNKVVTRDSLAQSLYGWGDDVDSNAIEVHIHNLRKKLGEALQLRTVRGIGYRLEYRPEE